MIVSNRKLFKKRPARDNLNQAAGIMASSPELMGEVQGFENGGNVTEQMRLYKTDKALYDRLLAQSKLKR